MTPRLEAARAEVARLLNRYLRPYATGRAQLGAAVIELEAAARESGDDAAPPMSLTEAKADVPPAAPAIVGEKPHEPPYVDPDAPKVEEKPTKPSGKHKTK